MEEQSHSKIIKGALQSNGKAIAVPGKPNLYMLHVKHGARRRVGYATTRPQCQRDEGRRRIRAQTERNWHRSGSGPSLALGAKW